MFSGPRRMLIAMTFAAGLSGCDEADDENELYARDAAVLERAASTPAISPAMARITRAFTSELDASALTDAEIVAAARQRAENRLRLVLAVGECEGTITLIGDDALHAVFDTCPLFSWTISADITGQVSVIDEPCDAAPCPARAAQWSLDIDALHITRVTRGDIEASGHLDVSRELVPGGMIRWAAKDLIFDGITERTLTVDSSAELAFEGADDECVRLAISNRLRVQRRNDADPDLGDIYLTVEGLRSCETKCPVAGDVRLAYGTGQLLRWSYDGSDEILATGPGGRESSALVECEPE